MGLFTHFRYLDLGPLKQVDLQGVGTANENNKDATPKGVKAYFNMDDSGILTLDKVAFLIYVPCSLQESVSNVCLLSLSELSSFPNSLT